MSFTTQPRDLLARIADRLTPEAAFVIHEHFDYGTWRSVAPAGEVDAFVQAVIRTWRESGGDADLGLHWPRWLAELGFDLTAVHPIVETTRPAEPRWTWLAAFIESGRKRMESLGAITPDQSRAIGERLSQRAADPNARMITPALFESIAWRRS
jgi:hypothetical protein